jgi:hypothetical protein
MSNYVKIFLADDGYYFNTQSNCEKMQLLATFLTSDVGCCWPGFKQWAEEEEYPISGGNISYLEKSKDYVVLTYEPTIFDQSPYFKIPRQAFIDLLTAWEKVCKQKPPQILITYDGQKFTVEGKETTQE